MNINIDSAIFIAFLLITIVAGLLSSHGIRNIKEYAVGDRNFSTATIAATIVATWASGQTFFTILAETYSSGLYFLWSVLGYILCLLSIGIYFAPRMGEFLGKLSIAEAMGDLYGKEVKVITAIAGFIASGGMIALQLKVSGFLFEYCFNYPEIYGIVIGGIIVTVYSSLGGIKSVTFTDVIQLFTFSTMIPALTLFILGTIDNTDLLKTTLASHELFDYKQVFDFSQPKSVYFIFLFLFNLIPAFNPAFFQRIAMAKNTDQIKKSFIIAAFTCLFIMLTISFISLLILSTHPNLSTNDITKHILFNYSYPGLIGFILAGIMAMVLSTADSYINSTSILFVNDFCKPLGIKIIKNDLHFSRVASAILGIVSIILALRSGSLLNLIIAANMFYMPIVTVPFILAVLGFRTSGRAVLIGMGGGFAGVVLWEGFLKTGNIDGLIPGMVSNLVFLFGSHYLMKEPGGWVGIKNDTALKNIKQQKSFKLKNLINSIFEFNLFTFVRKNSPNTEGVFVYFGLFCIISLYSTMSTIPSDVKVQYAALINFISPSVLFLTTTLLSYPLWPNSWKSKVVIHVIWNVVAFYVLICVGFIFVLLSNFAPLQVMILMINLILIAVLVRWQWSLFMMITGFLTVLYLFNYYLESDTFTVATSSLHLKVIYLLLLVSSILIIFLKPRQEQHELAEAKVDHLGSQINDREVELQKSLDLKFEFLRNIEHEMRTPITGITTLGQVLDESYDKLSEKQRRSVITDIAKSSERLNSLISNILDLSKLSSMTYELNKTKVDLTELLFDRIEACKKMYLNDKDLEFVTNVENDITLNYDKYYIKATFDNLIINAIQYSKQGKITISLKQDNDKVEFSIADEGLGIPNSDLMDVFGAFVVSSKTRTPAGGRGVGLALCKRVVEVHEGAITAESDGVKGATFRVILKQS